MTRLWGESTNRISDFLHMSAKPVFVEPCLSYCCFTCQCFRSHTDLVYSDNSDFVIYANTVCSSVIIKGGGK